MTLVYNFVTVDSRRTFRRGEHHPQLRGAEARRAGPANPRQGAQGGAHPVHEVPRVQLRPGARAGVDCGEALHSQLYGGYSDPAAGRYYYYFFFLKLRHKS
jgi:hypothetical protein